MFKIIAIIDSIIGTAVYILGTLVAWGVSFFTGVIRLLVSSSRDEKIFFFYIALFFSFDIYIISPVVEHNLIYWLIHPFLVLSPMVYLVRFGRGQVI